MRHNNLKTDLPIELDTMLDTDFQLIFQHLEAVLREAGSDQLWAHVLITLSRFLYWIDLRLITTSTLCQQMAIELFPQPLSSRR
jgi:hypothetical protein